ncbi:MAG TPA: hypothetical protein VG322_17180 [Candidatus Acidoferrales bacterium]|jgi:hypothetical protein|nr:hypothetical protein [Candidatus Acidoferrales bacterium]
MHTEYALPEVRLALKASQCSFEGCRCTVATVIESQPYCAVHFAPAALQEMEELGACLKQKPVDSFSIPALKKLLTDCAVQAQMLCDVQSGPVQDQTRLKDVLRRAAQLGKNLRRSPRLEACVPVWLRREDPRHTWEEETWTSTVSLHGAGFVCRHSVDVNGKVVLCRRDRGTRVEARVVYSRFDAEGRRHIGVELLGSREDFWDLPKLAASSAMALPVSA